MSANVERELIDVDERLVRLLAPPFTPAGRDPGYIKAYPPGIRENGGQYTHAAIWVGWAFADLGDGERAARVFDLLNPIGHALNGVAVQHYRVEPYVVAADGGGGLAITIENPDGVRTGVTELLVDGVPQGHGVVAFPADGHNRRVVVRLGSNKSKVPPRDETIGTPHAATA